jgi:2-polyprenyl-6-methoxyphenol hydroxylase-like FAD-dependent oxidoreductase
MHPHEGNGSPEDRRLQIAVAGGSIGGLCAGLALHGSGFDVNVYERHPGPMDTRGAGIVVQGELVRLLDTYGAPPLPTTSCRVRRYLDPQGGDGQVQSMPQAFTSWEAIYETLRAAFPKERYHMGATLVGVNDPGDGQAVLAEIEGHGHIKTDLLVCADGAQSPTPPSAPARRAVNLRGLCRLARHAQRSGCAKRACALFRGCLHLLRGPLGRAHPDLFYSRGRSGHDTGKATPQLGLVCRSGSGRTRPAADRPRRPPASRFAAARSQALVDRARHEVHPKLAELVAATPDPFVQTIVDVVVPRTVFGRVCLLGDAAFVVRPHTAGATAKAARDATVLATALKRARQNVDAGLRSFERGNRNHTERAIAPNLTISSVLRL